MHNKYYVAGFYFRGVSVRKNEKAAFDWFKKSAARGHADAQYDVFAVRRASVELSQRY
jgi:TPR repeat protein